MAEFVPDFPAHDEAALRFLGSGSEMRERVRAFDWSATPLGPVEGWPASLKTAAAIMLNAVQPMVLWWGDELVQIYNDAFVPAFGIGRHPGALGQPAARNGGELEECYFTYNLSPLRRLDGSVYGLMVIAVDVTQQVRARAKQRSRAAGFAGHLVKPIDMGELEAMLNASSAKGS